MTLFPGEQRAMAAGPVAQPRRTVAGRLFAPIDRLGAGAIAGWFSVADVASLSVALLQLAARPKTWRRTVRREFARQCYLSGVLAVPMILIISALVGGAVVAQVLNLFRLVGQDELIGMFMSMVLAREIAPTLVGLVLVGRSGTAIMAELATLQVNRQIKTLDAAGVDPVVYLILPRTLGLVVASVGLTLCLIAGAFFFGFIVGFILGYDRGNFWTSGAAAAGYISASDYVIVLIKSAMIGLLIGVVCCRRALAVHQVTQLPRALATGFITCVLMVFIVSGLITVVWEAIN